MGRGMMPFEHRRVSHLLPKDATGKEEKEVFKRARKRNITVTWSVDDAFITNDSVTYREVHVWDVNRVAGSKEELEEYVNTYHPPVPRIVYRAFDVEPPLTKPACTISLHRQTDEKGIEHFLNTVQPEWIKTVGGVEDARKYKAWGAKNVNVRYLVHNSKQYIDTCDVQAYLANFEASLEANMAYIDAVEDLNEENPSDPKVIDFCIAFSNEIKRRYGDDCKACSGNWAVGNGDGPALLRWARVIAENGHLGGYHCYHPTHPIWAEDWMETEAQWYHLRHLYHIDPYFVENDVYVDWLGTEAGAVAGVAQRRSFINFIRSKIPRMITLDPQFLYAKRQQRLFPSFAVGPLDPTGGWLDKDALGGDLDRYVALQCRLREKIDAWNLQHDNRKRGTAIFTVGAEFVGWNKFKLWEREMRVFADALQAG